jgi:hypothetical protein
MPEALPNPPKPATQAQIRAAELLDDLLRDGELGGKIRKLAKAKFPDANIVDIESVAEPLVAPLKAENKALKERLDALEAGLQKDKTDAETRAAQTNLEQALAKARQDYNLTDEGFDKMVARMKETGNYADADAAAAWVASKTPPAAPAGPLWRSQDLNLFGTKDKNEELARLHRDPIGFQDDQIEEFLRNPDKFVAETLGTQ